MKKINKIVIVFISILFFYSCCEKQNSDKPKQAIDYSTASKLQKEYIATRANVLNEHLNANGHFNKMKATEDKTVKSDFIKDVRDVTFDFATIKQYIAYVEKEAKEKGIDKKELKLRVYLGAYPTKSPNEKIKKEDLGYTTVFFMPVKRKLSNGASFFYQNDDEIIKDIDGLNMGQAGKPPHDLN
mgnify:FL=1